MAERPSAPELCFMYWWKFTELVPATEAGDDRLCLIATGDEEVIPAMWLAKQQRFVNPYNGSELQVTVLSWADIPEFSEIA